MWCFHKLALAVRARDSLFDSIGLGGFKGQTAAYLQYWAMNQIADPSGIFEPIRAELEADDSAYDIIITGHSHLREMHSNGKRYVNTGSWTFGSSQCAIWDGQDIRVITSFAGQNIPIGLSTPFEPSISTHEYISLVGKFMGWLRYRVAEKGRVVQPEQWKSTTQNGEDLHERTKPALQDDLDGGTPSVPHRSAETAPSVPDSKT